MRSQARCRDRRFRTPARILMRSMLTTLPTGRYTAEAGWSSLVARRAHNPEVEGSNPSPATIQSLRSRTWRRIDRNPRLCARFAIEHGPGERRSRRLFEQICRFVSPRDLPRSMDHRLRFACDSARSYHSRSNLLGDAELLPAYCKALGVMRFVAARVSALLRAAGTSGPAAVSSRRSWRNVSYSS